MNEFYHKLSTAASDDGDGDSVNKGWIDLYQTSELVRARFPSDNRIEQAQKMFYSDSPTILRSNENEPEANQQAHQQATLIHLSKRTFAKSFGRAFLTFRSKRPNCLTAEKYPIPALHVAAIFLPFKAVINLPSPHQQQAAGSNATASPNLPADYFSWPEFHHGKF
jgi:hypothetical protein